MINMHKLVVTVVRGGEIYNYLGGICYLIALLNKMGAFVFIGIKMVTIMKY